MKHIPKAIFAILLVAAVSTSMATAHKSRPTSHCNGYGATACPVVTPTPDLQGEPDPQPPFRTLPEVGGSGESARP